MSRGVKGLKNLGNTCYLNSSLQCLSHTVGLTRYFLDTSKDFVKKLKSSSKRKNLVLEYYNILFNLWKDSENTVLNISAFKNYIDRIFPEFHGYEHQDAGEFLIKLLDCLHEEISYKTEFKITGDFKKSKTDKYFYQSYKQFQSDYKNYSEIAKIFCGQSSSTLIFPEQEHTSHRFHEFKHLDLEISNSNIDDIYDCFDSHFNQEKLENIKYNLDENDDDQEAFTGIADAIKTQFIVRVPKVLIIILKRFNNDISKINKLIQFPIDNLEIEPYVLNNKKTNTKYSLYGIVCHYGDVGGGHYTAKCKNNGVWYHFNDSNVSVIDDTDDLVDSSAYILFYKQKESR